MVICENPDYLEKYNKHFTEGDLTYVFGRDYWAYSTHEGVSHILMLRIIKLYSEQKNDGDYVYETEHTINTSKGYTIIFKGDFGFVSRITPEMPRDVIIRVGKGGIFGRYWNIARGVISVWNTKKDFSGIKTAYYDFLSDVIPRNPRTMEYEIFNDSEKVYKTLTFREFDSYLNSTSNTKNNRNLDATKLHTMILPNSRYKAELMKLLQK